MSASFCAGKGSLTGLGAFTWSPCDPAMLAGNAASARVAVTCTAASLYPCVLSQSRELCITASADLLCSEVLLNGLSHATACSAESIMLLLMTYWPASTIRSALLP